MKTRILKLSKINVILISILLVVAYVGASQLWAFAYEAIVKVELSQYTYHTLQEGFDSAVSILFLCLLGYKGVLKQKGEGFAHSLYISGFLCAYVIYQIMIKGYMYILAPPSTINPTGEILAFSTTMFFIGVTEEIMLRGVVLNLLLERFSNTYRGIWMAVIIESVIFGAIHLGNVFIGADPSAVIWQVISATVTGILLSAIYIRSNNIWINIILHALYDFEALIISGIFGMATKAQFINSSSGPNWRNYLIMLIPALILLRRKKLKEIIRRREVNMAKVVNSDEKSARSNAIISVLLGISSIFAGWTGMLWICGVLGMLASKVSRAEQQTNNRLAQVGFVLSIIGTIFGILFAIGIIVYLLSLGMFEKLKIYNGLRGY